MEKVLTFKVSERELDLHHKLTLVGSAMAQQLETEIGKNVCDVKCAYNTIVKPNRAKTNIELIRQWEEIIAVVQGLYATGEGGHAE